MSWLKYRLSVIINCVSKSLNHYIALSLNLNRYFCSHCSHFVVCVVSAVIVIIAVIVMIAVIVVTVVIVVIVVIVEIVVLNKKSVT